MEYVTQTEPRGLFVGLTTVDIVFAFDAFPQEDSKNTARRYMAAAGGPASNAAVVFAHMGGASQLVSSLGMSEIADIARQDLASYGVGHLDLTVARSDAPALSAIAVAEDSGSRTILTSPAIDDDLDSPGETDTWQALVAAVDVVLIDGHQATVAAAIATCAHAAGKPVVLDGDLYKPGLDSLLPLVDVAIFGKSFSVSGVQDSDQLFDYFQSHGVPSVVATNGAEPIRYATRGTTGEVAVLPVRAVDTLAAGDFFHGAFCYAFARGAGVGDAAIQASEVAGRSVTQFGTRAWMATE